MQINHDRHHATISDIASFEGLAHPKDIALIKYMLEHGKEHAQELSEIGSRVSDAGQAEAAGLIADAVKCFEQAQEKLAQAVEKLEATN